ncbi:MAG: 5,10-methylenetetrahydrofolate reductase [Acidimicrobiales bacterium]|nr:MAG: 5,10-methylenetetrahydrofolate reductase [Acidimicrobiales bacterium]
MAKIADLLRQGRTFSFEFFPPKNDVEQATLVRTLRDLEPLAPSFVSVTYRGGSASRQRTHDLVAGMLRTTTLTPMAHLICVAHTRLELAEILVGFAKAGVENIMALGGDPPADLATGRLATADSASADSAPAGRPKRGGELTRAIQLVELAQVIGGFSVGVAAHPVGHPRSPDLAADRDHLAEKLAVADFAVTQFFFRAEEYLGLVGDLAARGMTKPVVPGIMPITSLSSLPRMAAMGAAVPPEMAERLAAAGDDSQAVRKAGIEMATELCDALLVAGAPGLHFYTLNRSTATREIYANLGLVPPPEPPEEPWPAQTSQPAQPPRPATPDPL